MGTNFYATIEGDGDVDDEVIHLGKLSAGWLPTIPYWDADKWFLDVASANVLRDEYGRVYTAAELIGTFIIHARRRKNVRRSGVQQVPFISFDCVGEKEFS